MELPIGGVPNICTAGRPTEVATCCRCHNPKRQPAKSREQHMLLLCLQCWCCCCCCSSATTSGRGRYATAIISGYDHIAYISHAAHPYAVAWSDLRTTFAHHSRPLLLLLCVSCCCCQQCSCCQSVGRSLSKGKTTKISMCHFKNANMDMIWCPVSLVSDLGSGMLLLLLLPHVQLVRRSNPNWQPSDV